MQCVSGAIVAAAGGIMWGLGALAVATAPGIGLIETRANIASLGGVVLVIVGFGVLARGVVRGE
jgi:hypothetical protein